MKHAYLFSLFVLALLGCQQRLVSESETVPEETNIAQVLTIPGFFDGHLVTVTGAVVARFEANVICPDESMFGTGQNLKCLWIRSGHGVISISPLHNKVVSLTGFFDADHKGHGVYGGTITPLRARILGRHDKGDPPPPPP